MKLTPIAPRSDLLDQKIMDIISLNSQYKTIPESIRSTVKNLLVRLNSYYSNKIEGNPTKPKELLAMKDEDVRVGKRGIEEVRRHIQFQKFLLSQTIKPTQVPSKGLIEVLHEGLYEGSSEEERTIKEGDKILIIKPGEYRKDDVKVGSHIPPEFGDVDEYMQDFCKLYRLSDQEVGLEKYYKAAASHHRFVWIHPFLDGNGRVSRLFTDCYMRAIGLDSYDLWSMSRGFARNVEEYCKYLAWADSPRQGNYDGKGILSDKGLAKFTEYFFDVAIDQMKFFLGMLDPETLRLRVGFFFDQCAAGAMNDLETGEPLPKLPKEAKDIYLDLLYSGEKMRKDLEVTHRIGEKKLRDILTKMEEQDLVVLGHRQPVKASLSASCISSFFPNLFG